MARKPAGGAGSRPQAGRKPPGGGGKPARDAPGWAGSRLQAGRGGSVVTVTWAGAQPPLRPVAYWGLRAPGSV